MPKTLLEIQQELDALHTEAKGALDKTVCYVCPWNCEEQRRDQHGYCQHLVGFTNDRETYEPVAPLYRRDREGVPFDTGWKRVGGAKLPCAPGDVFVNPERPQIVDGLARMAKAWVSDRVYRKDARAPEPAVQPVQPLSELARFQREEADLKQRLEERRLRKDIERMRRELAEADAEEKARVLAEAEEADLELATRPGE